MERKEIVLIAQILMKEENGNIYPCIRIDDQEDENGNALIGNCMYHSVESLARIYQADNKYKSKEKFIYSLRWKNSKNTTPLFQKTIINGYGEPNTYIDETDKH